MMPYWRAYYHLVWATRSRLPLITPNKEKLVYRLITSKACMLDAHIYAIGGMPDHVHVVVALPPKYDVSSFVHTLKGSSSYFLNRERTESFRWQKGYGMFTVGCQGVDAAIDYVQRQKEHHAAGTVIDALEYYSDEEDGPTRPFLRPEDF